jgi:hypothetical protein
MLNFLKRWTLLGERNRTFSVMFIGKVGLGVMFPHVDNTVLGNESPLGPKVPSNWAGYNSGWWQLAGWTTGIEAALRFVLISPIYIEFADKVAFSSMGNIPVYEGRAEQNFWMNMWSFNLGVTINPKHGL